MKVIIKNSYILKKIHSCQITLLTTIDLKDLTLKAEIRRVELWGCYYQLVATIGKVSINVSDVVNSISKC